MLRSLATKSRQLAQGVQLVRCYATEAGQQKKGSVSASSPPSPDTP